MTREDFQNGMQRIINNFGDKNYPRDKLELIFKAVENISIREFGYICDDFIADARQAPNRQNFLEAAKRFKKELRPGEREKVLNQYRQNLPTCSFCGNTGSIRAWLKTDPVYSAVFRCNCEIAAAIGNNWPTWTDDKIVEWDAEFFHDQPLAAFERTRPIVDKTSKRKTDFFGAVMPGYAPLQKQERECLVVESKKRAESSDEWEEGRF